MNLPEKNIGRTLLNINHNNMLLPQSLKEKEIKAKMNKWELWKQCQTLFFGAPKSLQMVTAAMKLKDAYSLEEKL